MKRSIRNELVKRLRSGDYIQGIAALRQKLKCEDKNIVQLYCCLGVLCEIHAEETERSWNTKDEDNGQCQVDEIATAKYGRGNTGELPPLFVYTWAGMTKKEGLVLANLNDDGVLFPDIAAEIEKTL